MGTIAPLAGLEVVTPRLALRYITDDLGVELALLAAEGIHDPATMPFSSPWTDVPSPELERNTLRFYWRNHADTTVEHWDLNLAVVVDGAAVGHVLRRSRRISDTAHRGDRLVGGTPLPTPRELDGRCSQAALHLIFAGFEADQATTRAWHDNTASLRATRSLPYIEPLSSDLRVSPSTRDKMLEFAIELYAQWATRAPQRH